MVRWIAAASTVASVVCASVVPGQTVTAAAAAIQASATVRGVTLSLVVPRRTYPRNSLVRVTVRVKNGSPDPMTVVQPACRA